MNAQALKKKVGPLPLYAWALIAVGIIGYVMIARRKNAASDTAQTTDQADSQAQLTPTQGGLDGATGGGAGAITGSSSPAQTLTGEIGDISGLVDALNGLGLGAGGYGGPITVPPGSTLYDPVTGISVTAPGGVGSGSTSSTGGTPGGGKSRAATLLDKAKARVSRAGAGGAAAKPGSKTYNELRKAGYSAGQISHAASTGQALGKPKGSTNSTKSKATPKAKAGVAATHPLQHVTAAATSHKPPPKPITRHKPAPPPPPRHPGGVRNVPKPPPKPAPKKAKR